MVCAVQINLFQMSAFLFLTQVHIYTHSVEDRREKERAEVERETTPTHVSDFWKAISNTGSWNWRKVGLVCSSFGELHLRLVQTIWKKILHSRQKSGHVFNHLGRKNSYRFWLGEADGSGLREQDTAAVAAATATATVQLFSIWQKGLWAAKDESDLCMLYRHLWRIPVFPFHLCHTAAGVEMNCTAPASYKHPFPSHSVFPSVWTAASPNGHSMAGLHHAGGNLESPSKGAINILQVLHPKIWANVKLSRSSNWGPSHWSLGKICRLHWQTQGCAATTLQSFKIWSTHLNL